MKNQSSVHAKPGNAFGSMQSNANLLQRQSTLGTHVCVQREAATTEAPSPSLVREVMESPGQPLDSATRSAMEPRFGFDFSQVRVHTGEQAAETARAMKANAYTAGQHVVFDEGKYAPGSSGGNGLIAHELTHVVQQASGPVEGTPVADGLSVSHPSDRFEQAASRVGVGLGGASKVTQAASPRSAATANDGPITLQRQVNDTSGTGDFTRQQTRAGEVSAVAGGASAVVGIIGLIPAFQSAGAAKEQAKEAHEQTGIARESLAVAKDALSVAENPPVGAPTTGGIVVNNNNAYADIADTDSKDTRGEPKEIPLTILKVSQGANDFATFNAVVQSNGKNIKGGYLQDGPAQGYLGGSAAANLNLTLKPMMGPRTPFTPPKGKPTTVGSVRFLMSGNNIAPRTRTGTQIQRFSGAVTITAAGETIVSSSFFANPGTKTPGKGTDAPAISIDLPATAPAAGVVPVPAPVQTPAKSAAPPTGGTPPK